jgi:microcystin-dependent protein
MSVADALGNQGFSLPVGTILSYAGLKVPQKYLLCDGTAVSKTRYPELHASLGYIYGGAGDSFTLPDLVNKIITGTDANANTSTAGTATTATFNATILEANMPDIPNTSFEIDFPANKPVTSVSVGSAGQGICKVLGANTQQVSVVAPPAGFEGWQPSAHPPQTSTAISVTFNSLALNYTGTGTPISQALTGITTEPKSYSMLYIIKAEY